MRQPQRSQQQWLALFEQQAQSGLTAVQFCQSHSINIQTFYARRSDIKIKRPNSGFVKVHREVTTVEQRCDEPGLLQLRLGKAELRLPPSVDPRWLAALIKALSL